MYICTYIHNEYVSQLKDWRDNSAAESTDWKKKRVFNSCNEFLNIFLTNDMN